MVEEFGGVLNKVKTARHCEERSNLTKMGVLRLVLVCNEDASER